MGMESFFVMLLPEGIYEEKDDFGIRSYIGESQISKQELLNFIQNQSSFHFNDNIIFEDILMIKILTENDKVQQISIECCFYHYNEGLEKIFKIWKFINKKFNFRLYHPAIGFFENSDINEYQKKLKSFYLDKHDTFIKDFGEIKNNEKVLPNEGFMKYLKSIGKV